MPCRTFKDADEFYKTFIEYIEDCSIREKLPNVAGFCRWCHMNRDTYYAQKDYYSDTFKEIEEILEDEAINNKFTNDTLKIFYLKNKCGYRDKHEIDADVDSKVEIRVDLEDE